MKIMIDQEAMQVLRQICDAALKGAGLGIMDQVNKLSACIQPFPVSQPKEKKNPEEVKEVAKDEQEKEQKEEEATEIKEVS